MGRVRNPATCRGAVQMALARGDLAPAAKCEACGHTKATTRGDFCWHHWSYERAHWLDVIEMCRSCHGQMHLGKIPEPRTGRIYDASPIYEKLRRPRPRMSATNAAKRAARAA